MEVSASGFSQGGNNAVSTVKGVAALTLTVSRALTTEGISAGRTIAVGFPELVAWENEELQTEVGRPYFLEQYFPGPSSQFSVGKVEGLIEADPQYSLAVYVPANTGSGSAYRYANAIQRLFAPHTAMTLDNGDTLRVRGDVGPFASELAQEKSGWAVINVTIPLRIYTSKQ
jgi:hypothetical protein